MAPDSPAYLRWSGVNFTVVVAVVAKRRIDRIVALQTFPGIGPVAAASRLLLVRFATADAEHGQGAVRSCFDPHPEAAQVRLFADQADGRFVALIAGHGDLARLLDYRSLRQAGVDISAVETYLPY